MAEVNSFHETLKKLKELQIVLNKKFKLEKALVDLPKDVELNEQIVFRMKENYLLADSQYQEMKKKVTLKKDELDRLQEHRNKYEKEIAQVSSQRDYEQIDRAIKENQEQELVMQSEYNSLEGKLKLLESEYNSTEGLLKEQEESLAKLKKELNLEISKCNRELEDNKKQELKISQDIDSKLVFKFERIIKSKEGDGIVPVKKNICNGCHMILPLQFVNEVCKEEEVMNCPYCSKILYYDGEGEVANFEQNEASGLQDLFNDEDIEFDEFDDEDYELFIEKDNIGSDSFSVATESCDNTDEDDIDDDIDDDIESDLDDIGEDEE